jgi:hypothetical protein
MRVGKHPKAAPYRAWHEWLTEMGHHSLPGCLRL